MVIAAHPDDETMGFGGVLARYASEGVETSLIVATRGDRGKYRGHAVGSAEHPGRERLSQIREQELRAACAVLAIRDLTILDYDDQQLDAAEVRPAVAAIVHHIRRVQPHVVLTFAPDGGYGHPDHIAVSQWATGAIVAAADAQFASADTGVLGPAHTVSKLYFIAWDEETWAAYRAVFKRLVSMVDGVERQATAWPAWMLTTTIDTGAWASTVGRAVACHQSQLGPLQALEPNELEALLSTQSFYRAFSLVNGGRHRESDLFEGIDTSPRART
jgi:LmbE family N-acetylglucosaminyl deacetylase